MSWRSRIPGPSWKDYEEFLRDLSARTPAENVQSCLGVFFATLILVPMAVLFLLGLFLGLGPKISTLSYGCLFIGLAGYLIIKGRKTILDEEIFVLPRARVRGETSFVGGRVTGKVKGAAAKRLGALLIAAGIAALGQSIMFFLQMLR